MPCTAPKQDAALAEDVGAVLRLQRRLEGVGRAQRHRPAQRIVGRLAVHVLVDGEARIDAGAIDLAALLVEPAHRGAHALGADGDDVDVLGEVLALRLQVRQQEAVAEAERRAGTEGGEDLLVVLGEGGVGDQQQRHVALADHVVHLAQRAVLLGEADRLGLLHRGGAFAQADLDLDAGALKRTHAGSAPGPGPARTSR